MAQYLARVERIDLGDREKILLHIIDMDEVVSLTEGTEFVTLVTVVDLKADGGQRGDSVPPGADSDDA